jgi:branched-chain amino acid aminotransferase
MEVNAMNDTSFKEFTSKPGIVMRDADVWLDGQFLDYKHALISPLSHSLGYATTVYEGIRSYGGALFYFDEHIERLRGSATIFGHTLPISTDELRSACESLLSRNGLIDGYVKVQIFFDDADVSFKGIGCRSRMFLSTSPKPAQNATAWSLSIAHWRRANPACHPYQAKTSSTYALSYLSHRARPEWADDVLFLSDAGFVCEASGANVGFVKGNCLVMPGTERALAGITRQVIIDELAPRYGLEVSIEDVHIDDIAQFDGAFVCGTAVEVIPVSRICSVTYAAFDVPRMLADGLVELASAASLA